MNTHIFSIPQRLKKLGYSSYKIYLNSDHWKDVRKKFWASKLPKYCGGCGSKKGLSLHHKTYKRLGSERLTDFILVCNDCHLKIHKKNNNNKPLSETTSKVLRKQRKINNIYGLSWTQKANL
jgi:5-methylcytosine-specific restriction endonuclease McrA